MINITLSNAVGFPGGLTQNNPPNNLMQTILPSVYEYGNAFSIDVNFIYVADTPTEGETNTITGISLSLTSFASTLIGTSVIQVSPTVLRISGQAKEVFTDAFYEFLMPDNTTKILPQDTTEEFLALTRWNPPATKRATVSHSISYDVTYIGSVSNTTINTNTSFTQEVVWNYNTAVLQFREVLSRGVI